MLKFESAEFLNKLKEHLTYWVSNSSCAEVEDLIYDFYDILDEDFDPAEYDDDYMGFDTVVNVNYDGNGNEITFKELFKLIDIVRNSKLINNLECVSETYFLCRVSVDYEQIKKVKNYFTSSKALVIEDIYNNNNVTCAVTRGLTAFGLKIKIEGDYDDDIFPWVLDEDFFIEIISSSKLSTKDFENVLNSYIFEIDSSHDISFKVNRRPHFYEVFEDSDEDEILSKEIRLRPILSGKGISEVLDLFNNATGNTNLDMIIIQYTKVLEYISQTVARQKITKIIQNKLMTPEALNPNADFIHELELTFDELKQKYNTDRNLIKAVIESCCDLEYISCYAPPYLKKVKELKAKLRKPKADKDLIIKEVIGLVSDSISDTRNYIAHSKANYTPNGNECPEIEKQEFIKMLKAISMQAIRWFSKVSEEDRITN